MKSVLLLLFICTAYASNSQVNNLPEGRYETTVKDRSSKWDKGDILILNDSQYKISTGKETGEYKFSVTAQRIFFTSGPLKGLFARTAQTNGRITIVIPKAENEQLGYNTASADIWGILKQ